MTTVAAVLAGFDRLPFATDAAIAGDACLILAPHPDDESLGCGGLIARLCDRGTPPVIVILTDGSRSHPNSASYPPARLAALREDEAAVAVGRLGLPADRLHFLRATDAAAPHQGPALEALADSLAALVATYASTTLLTTWPHDPHCDHLAAWHLARAVARRLALRLLCYPVWGMLLPPETILPDQPWTGHRLDITDVLDRKRRAIAAHVSQATGLIADDPDGFRLPAALLATFTRPTEHYLEPPADA